MRIALCMSGLARSLGEGRRVNHQEILSRYDKVDIFFNVWTHDFEDPKDATAYTLHRYYNDIKRKRLEEPFDIGGEFISKLSDPEKYKPFFETRGKRDRTRTLNMIYMIWRCNQLKCEVEKGEDFTYDIVIRSRPDGRYTIPNPIVVEPNTIYMPAGHSVQRDRASDTLAYGSSKVMDIYSSMWERLYIIERQFEEDLGSNYRAARTQIFSNWMYPHWIIDYQVKWMKTLGIRREETGHPAKGLPYKYHAPYYPKERASDE